MKRQGFKGLKGIRSRICLKLGDKLEEDGKGRGEAAGI